MNKVSKRLKRYFLKLSYCITIYTLYVLLTGCFVPDSLQKQLYVDRDVNQIEEFSFLSQSSNKATFHLVTHGKPGKLLIEGKWFNAKEIARFLAPKISNSTFKIQNLNIYGCEFAKGDQGIEAVRYLEAELGVKIAASNDVTGKDGDWELEVGNHFVQGLENYKYNLQCAGTAGGTAPVDDFDGDGVCNGTDIDDDNDGVLDVDENFCGRSAANPFTSLEQARATVKRAGIYYFNLSGNKFSTHVNTDGYVLVAVDYGNGSGVLPVTPNLGLDRTYNKRGLLNPTALAALGTVEKIRISSNTSSAGGVDVTSMNTTLIDRVKNNKSLQRGNEGTDNTLNNSWTGLNEGYLQADANGTTSTTNSLTNNIIHISNNLGGFHWVPSVDNQRVYWEGLEIPDQDYFALWVRGNATGTACYTNTDGTASPNHMDLDSDDDGCSDAFEAGATNDKTTNYKFTSADSTPKDGLVDMVDNGANGGTSGDGKPDYIFRAYYPYDATTNYCIADFDNDGVLNQTDLDDDNDGILDLEEGACPNGISPRTAFMRLSQARNVPSGRYYFNLGNGIFQADVDNSEGGGWILVLQYTYQEGGDSNLAILTPGDDFPVTSTAVLGTDESLVAKKWGHAGNAALNQFSEDFEIRFYGEASGHDRKIHFKTTLGTSYVKTGSGSFSGIESAANHTLLSGHTANLPAQANSYFNDEEDRALTDFPFYKYDTYHWGVKGDGLWWKLAGGRWEVDNYSRHSINNSTIHRIWIRSTTTSNCKPVDTDKDGVPNHLDLDSDGDGCPDVVESGVKDYIKSKNLLGELVSGDVENKDPDNSGSTTSIPTEGAMLNPTNGGDDIGPNNGFHDELEETSHGMYDATYKEDAYMYRRYNACRQRKIYSNPAMHTLIRLKKQ